MSRCSEQKQQMKWEPLPLPMVDESLCFSTTENAPASWKRRWMMQVFSLTPWTRPLCGKQCRLQVWCYLADALAEANITRRIRSSQDWVQPITKPLALYSHLCASLKGLQGPAPIVSRRLRLRHGCSSSDFKTRFSWFWSTFTGRDLFVFKAMLIRIEMGRWISSRVSIGCEWCEWNSLSWEQEECLLRCKFIKDSSYIGDDLSHRY